MSLIHTTRTDAVSARRGRRAGGVSVSSLFRIMGRRITLLRTQRHGEFLGAQRKDPVTRKVFTAGDRVTLCATCLLPFLEESWDGMGGAHCGQTAAVGLEAFEPAATTPADESSGNSSAGDTDVKIDGRSSAEASDNALKLRPIPFKLRQAPLKLRG